MTLESEQPPGVEVQTSALGATHPSGFLHGTTYFDSKLDLRLKGPEVHAPHTRVTWVT